MIRGSRVRGFIGGVGTVLALFWLTAVQAQTPCASLTTDIDGDGIPDINDNCINVPNANQRDTSGTGIGNACNPDLNHDGIVNLQDLALFKIAYAAYNSPAHTYTPNADFNGDGKIDTADLAILESFMGKPPGPSALVPTLRAIPTSVNFGAVFVGVSASVPVNVQNNGCLPVQIVSATISGDPSFTVFPPTNLTLTNPGQMGTINVGYKPTSTTSVTATLTLTTNSGMVICITLVGTGITPAAGQVPILVAPAVLSFGTVSSGGMSTQTLTIGNIGTAPLIVSGITPNSSLFTVDPSLLGGFPLILAPSASVSMPVKFAAGATPPGPVNSSLVIANNDPLRSNWTTILQASVAAPAPVTVNNPVTSVQVFDGSTPITATNCASVTRAVSFGAGTNSGDTFEVVMTDGTGKSVTSAPFPAPSSPGTQVLSGINVCGLADSTISTTVIYTPASAGTPPPPFVGTPATKDTSTTLAPPTLIPPSAPYFTSFNATICGTSRASTTVTINGGTSPVGTTLNATTTTFCLSVPLQPNQQNTLIATAVDNLAAPPRPSESSIPLLVTQINPSQIFIASATSTPLTASQVATLVANGVINLGDPSNFNVSIFTIVLTIGSLPVTVTQPVVVPISSGTGSGGGFVLSLVSADGWVQGGGGPPAGGGGGTAAAVPTCTESCSTIIAIQPPQGPVIPGILIIDGTIKTLKEFFQVTLAVQNTSSVFTLTDVGSSLTLPAGSLTAVSAGIGTNVGTLTTNSANNSISLGAIAPGATGSGQFVIRGDAIGTYSLAVAFDGTITGGGLVAGIPFNGQAGTSVQVFGPPDLSVVVHHPRPSGAGYDVIAGQTFTLTVDITNNSTRPALYPSLDLVVGGNETLIDPTTLLPVSQELTSLPNINPGQTVSASFLAQSSIQGYIIACQGLSSSNISLSVDINANEAAPCNIANTVPASFAPPSPTAAPTVLGISPANGQGNQPITSLAVAELTPVSACLIPDAFTNVVTAPINPSNPAAGIQVTSADLATPGTFYIEELDANGNSVRHVPVQLTSVADATNGTTVATLHLGLASPASQYLLKSLTNYRVTLVGADMNAAAGAVCNAANQSPLAASYQWTFQTTLSCVNDTAPVASLSEPLNGSIGQLVTTPILLNFTNSINGSTFKVDPANALNDSFAVFAGATIVNGDVSGGTLIAGNVNLTNVGKTLTFTPQTNLPYSTPIVVRLTNALQDGCGTALSTAANGVQLFSFQTSAAPVAPPAAPKVNPLPAITNLSTIAVTGSAPAGTTITVTGGVATVSGATASGGNFSLQATLNLNQKNTFSVTATDSAGNVSTATTTDTGGNPLIVQSDQTAPTVISTSPQGGATGVAVASAISVVFSKPINVGTANTLNVLLTAGGQSVSGVVSAAGSGLTIAPSAALTAGTLYQLRIRAGGVSDLAGNTLASDYIVTFTTASTTPTLTSVTPNNGTVGTTFPVTFSGTNLSGATAAVSNNTGVSATITGTSSTTVSATVVISATAATGAYTLGVTVGGQTVSLPFTINPATPTLTSVSPNSGTVGTSFPVTFTGTNLSGASAIVSGNAGVSATITGASTSTTVTATVVITSTATTGATTLGVLVNGTPLSLPFTVVAATPTLTSITSSGGSSGSGTVGTNTTFTFTGTNLSNATAVVSGNPGVTGTIISTSATSVTASITISATAVTGATTLGLIIGGQTFSLPFTVNAATPTLTSISPNSGTVGTTITTVTFTGTNLSKATAITSANPGVTGTITGTPAGTTVTATVVISATAATGATTLGVIVGGTPFSLPFTVASATPTLTSVSPNSGSVGTSFPMTFTGTNLSGTTAVVSSNAGVSATITGTPTGTTVTAAVVISATAATGAATIGLVVGGTPFSLPFTVLPPTPTISSLAPAAGEQGHTVSVLITGTNLLGITSLTVSGAGVTAAVVGGGTATSQTANFVIASSAPTGARIVSLVTASGTANATFTVNPAATLSVSLTPNPLTVSTESTTTLTVTLSDLAPTGGQVVNLTTGSGLVSISPTSVTIAQNQTTANVSVTSTATTGSDLITASGTGLTSGTDPVQVQARGFSLNAGLVGINRTATGSITLSQPAPSSGATINLSVLNPALVSVSPSSVTISSGQTTATFTLSGGSTTGLTTLTADGTASGFVVQTATLTVSNLLINLSTAQTLGFGQSGTYQVQIAPNAAGAGGVVVTLASSNTNIATVPATVTIPAGAFSANFTVQAGTTATGASTITASNTNFASTTTTVNVTAALLLGETSKTLSSSQTDTIDFQLTSGGNPYNAPAGGVVVTGSSSDSTCVNVTSTPVTVAAGQSFGSVPIAYGSTATLPCTATVTLSNALYGTANISVTYQAAATIGTMAFSALSFGVGNGLEQPITLTLSAAAPTGGVTVEVRSATPSVLLVSPGPTTLGSPAINVVFAAGTTTASFYAQAGFGSTGTVTLTATTPKYTTGTSAVAVVSAAISMSGAPTSTTTLSGNSTFNAVVGALYGGGANLFAEPVSPTTGPLSVTAASTNSGVGALLTGGTDQATATGLIPIGTSSTSSTGGTGFIFVPLSNGTTTLSLSAPGFASATTNVGPASQTVTVSQPAFTLSIGEAASSSTVGLGAGLEMNAGSISLGAPAPSGGTTIQVTSSDTTKVVLSNNGTNAGLASVNVVIPAGSSSGTFWLQGVAVGSASITATNPSNAYSAPGAQTAAVVSAAISMSGAPTNPTDLSGNSTFNVIVGALYGGGADLFAEDVSPATGALTVSVASTNSSVGALLTGGTDQATATGLIPIGASSTSSTGGTGFTFVPLANGTTTLNLSSTGFASATTNVGPASQTVTVSQPAFTLSIGEAASSSTVGLGAGLEMNAGSISLGDPAPSGGTTIQVTSSDTTKVVLSNNGTTAGLASINVVIPAGSSSGTFWLQGVAVGSASITATNPSNAYSAPGAQTAAVVSAAISMSGAPTSTTTLSGNSTFNVIVGALYGGGADLFAEDVSPATGALTVSVASTNSSVGALLTGGTDQATATGLIPIGASSTSSTGGTGFTFVPLANGTTTLNLSSTGFASATTNVGPASQTVTVSQPAFTLSIGEAASSSTVGLGAGLEMNAGSISLGDPAPSGGTTIQVTSSDTTKVVLSNNGTTAGLASINVVIPAGSSSGTFWLQGVAVGSANITATNPSDTFSSPAADVAAVVSAAISMSSAPTSTTTLSGNSTFNVIVGALYGGGADLFAEDVSPATGALTVSVASTNSSVGALLTGGTDQATATGLIPIGASSTSSTGGTGFTFVPLANGTTTLNLSSTGFASATTNVGPASQLVTVTPSALTLQSGILVGGGLQVAMNGSLQAATNDGGVTINIASSDPTKLLVSPNATTPGTAFINVFVANGTLSYTFYVQGVAGATGSVTLTASSTDTQFTTGTTSVSVVEPQLVFYTGLPTTEPATSADVPFEIATFVPGYSYEDVAAGSSLLVTVSSSNTAVASLTTLSNTQTSPVTVTLQAGTETSPATVAGGGVALHAVAAGSTNISATAPGTLPALQAVTLN